MSDNAILARLRTFLFALAAFILAGSLAELLLINHMESVTQFIPLGLAGVGVAMLVWVLIRPYPLSLQLLRIVMVTTVISSAFGIYEHIEGNLAFELEIRPNAVASDYLFEALSGANPLLAPGILGMAAVIALAATYYHPELAGKR